MKTRVRTVLSIFLISLIAGLVPAWAGQDDYPEIVEMFKKLSPNKKIDSIQESVIPGLYQVNSGVEVLYATKDGKYLMAGEIYNMENRTNITEETRTKGRLELVKNLDPSSMIIFSPAKKAKHKVTVFTDIDCGFCRKLHNQITEYNNRGIEIRYLAYPRAGLNSPSYDKAVSVWCAKDKRAAMTRAKRGDEPESKTCNNPVKTHMLLAEQFGLTGTPTLILEDGTLVGGYLEPDKLLAVLDKASSTAAK